MNQNQLADLHSIVAIEKTRAIRAVQKEQKRRGEDSELGPVSKHRIKELNELLTAIGGEYKEQMDEEIKRAKHLTFNALPDEKKKNGK